MDVKLIASTVQVLSPSRKDITVEVTAEEAAREFDIILEKFAANVKMPGFRQGKVPLEIVRKKYAEEIHRALIDELAPKALQAGFREHGVEPVGLPVVRDIDFAYGQPLRFKAEIDVWPEIDISDFQSIKIKKKDITVEEEEIVQYLEQLRQHAAEYVPVQGRGVVEGDYVAVETQGADVKAGKRFPLEKSVLLAGPSEDNPMGGAILGLSEGEEARFEHVYPEDHPDKRLAGKTVGFRVKILTIKEKKVPALDDDLAKTLGEFENLESLKQRIRSDLKASKENALRNEAAREILEKLSDRIPDDLPRTLVEQETQDLLRKFLKSPESRGLEAGGRTDWESLKSKLRKDAERTIKNHIVLKAVAARENLRVGEEEFDEEIRRLARSNGLPEARLRSLIEEEGRMEGLRESLLFRKAVDFLVDKAIM
ncbi:MAG: trigger factor [Candidatus Aminicenantes bacterium]|nr:trigger factor [Candidatus Aminicenantes bacterium]